MYLVVWLVEMFRLNSLDILQLVENLKIRIQIFLIVYSMFLIQYILKLGGIKLSHDYVKNFLIGIKIVLNVMNEEELSRAQDK